MATEQRKIDRFVELAGSGVLSTNEAARAAGISEGTKDRLMRRPDVRQRVEELRAKTDEGILEDVRETIDELLQAVDRNGDADWAARARGAELLMKHQDKFEEHDIAAADAALPEGVYVVYPRVTA